MDLTCLLARGPHGEQDEGGRALNAQKGKSDQRQDTTPCLYLHRAPPCQVGPTGNGWGPAPQHAPSLALTGKDVLVAVLGLVLQPLSLLPWVQEPTFLLLQHLMGQRGAKASACCPTLPQSLQGPSYLP